jgi:hypothetical protein
MAKMTFKPGANMAAIAKAIHSTLNISMPQAKAAAEKGEVDVPDQTTAKALGDKLELAGAEDIKNPFLRLEI